MVLIFCADCQKWYDAFVCAGCEPRLPRAGDLMLAVTDCAIAAQNAVTAADSLEEAVEMARLLADKEDVIVAFGSLSYLGRMLEIVGG